MAEIVKKEDFIEIEYTGKLTDGTIFDTTNENVAKDQGIYNSKTKFGPAIVCVGESQILPGLDQELEGKEVGKEYTLNLQPEQAFGKRDVKKMRMMPTGAFKEHNMQPQPGLQIEVDGQMGTISRVSGGRVIVNFNHPLAGKEVIYEFKILKKINDVKEQLSVYLENILRIPKDKLNLEIKEEKAEVKLPFDLPQEFTKALSEKIIKIIKLNEVKFVNEKKSTEQVKKT